MSAGLKPWAASVLTAILTAPAAAVDAPATPSLVTIINQAKGDQNLFDYDFGPPQSPAITLLGLEGTGITPATSLKAFVVQAGSVLDGGSQSIALDISPAALLGNGNNLDRYIADGSAGQFYRLARRTKIDIAALNGKSGDSPIQSGLAIGVSISLLDSSDPWRTSWRNADKAGQAAMTSLPQCLRDNFTVIAQALSKTGGAIVQDADSANNSMLEVAQDALSTARNQGDAVAIGAAYQSAYTVLEQLSPNDVIGLPPQTDKEPKVQAKTLLEAIDKARQRYRDSFAKAIANQADIKKSQALIDGCSKKASRLGSFATDLDIGVGTFWRGKAGELSDLRNGGGAAWLAFQMPIPGSLALAADDTISAVWMIGASGRFGWKETIATADTTVPEIRANTLKGWAGVERRSDSLLLSARYGYEQVRANDAIGRFYNRSGDRFLFQGQIRLGTDSPLWLGLTYGNAGGTVDAYNAKRLLVTLAFSPPKPANITNIKD